MLVIVMSAKAFVLILLLRLELTNCNNRSGASAKQPDVLSFEDDVANATEGKGRRSNIMG